MNVPPLDSKAQHEPIEAEIVEVPTRVFRSRVFIMRSEVEKLEERIASCCGTRFAVGVSSGTGALLVALMALEVGAVTR